VRGAAIDIPPLDPAPAARDAPDEPDLVRRAQAGSREAAAELFRRHWADARRAALAITGREQVADDIAQDAFQRAFGSLRRFDAARPFAPYLHRIVVNRALDELRRERRFVGLDDAPEGALAVEDHPRAPDRELLAALATIAPERRAVIVLRYLLGYEPREIAPVLGLPLGTVSSRLARGLADLRERLEERA